MKRPQDEFLLLGAQWCERVPLVSHLVAKFYLLVVLPVLSIWCFYRFKDAFTLIPRHSLLKDTFNPFLSDIDLTVVMKKGHEDAIDEVVDFFLWLSQKSMIFDLPQVYLEEEWRDLSEWEKNFRSELTFIWNFRKLSWMTTREHTSEYEKYKKNRSRDLLIKALFKTTCKKTFGVEDLKLEIGLPHGQDVCCWSPYLELTSANKVLLCSKEGLEGIFSLLPGEKTTVALSERQQEFKRALWVHEYLLSRSDLRISSRTGNDCAKGLGFIRWLELEHASHYDRELVLKGPAWDFLKKAVV